MYLKNLDKSLRIRVSSQDMDFLIHVASQMGLSVSEYMRVLIRSARGSYVGDFDDKGGADGGNEETHIIHII